MAVKELVRADTTAERIYRAVAAGGAKGGEEDLLDHFGGRLDPTLIFVKTHALAAGTVNDVVFAVEMRGVKRTHEDGDGIDAGGRRVCGVIARDRELVGLSCTGRAAGRDDERTENRQTVCEAI